MRSILQYILLSFMIFLSYSCTTAYAVSDDIYYNDNIEITTSTILAYGTPYYSNGTIIYYTYNNRYYYPFYYDNYLYYRVFDRPIIHYHYHFGKPHRGDIGYNRYYRHHHNHHVMPSVNPRRPYYNGHKHYNNHNSITPKPYHHTGPSMTGRPRPNINNNGHGHSSHGGGRRH